MSASPAAPPRKGRFPQAFLALGLVLATLAAYGPALSAGFIWDDDGHVTRPALRSLGGLLEIWFKLGATQQYYPVLHTAFWIEHRLWGDSALGYHLVTILLHALGACLFVRLLQRLAVPGAWAAGLLFALHPIEVESVAWISEQKNTLSGVFYLLSALAYLRFRERRAIGAYFGAFGLFLLALGSKSVTATLPEALLVILWWKDGSLSFRKDVVPLVPWIAVGLAAGLFTAWVETTYIGAGGAHLDLSFGARALLAGRVPLFYLGKLLWPSTLLFVYPRWVVATGAPLQYLFPAGLLALFIGAFAWRRHSRAPLAILLLFVGTLVPALGFLNAFPFVFSYVADHFQYLAGLAPIAGVAAAGALLSRRNLRFHNLAFTALAAVALILGCLTWRQAIPYRSAETLYTNLLAQNPDAWLAHDNLGVIEAGRGQIGEAIEHYRKALALNPHFPQTYNNLGNALAREERWSEASQAYAQALRLQPGFTEADNNWGNALSEEGLYPDAVARFQDSLSRHSDNPEAEFGLASALANEGRIPDAIPHFRAALTLRPDYAEAYANLGLALVTTGHPDEALGYLNEALKIRPNYAEAHAYLGLAYARKGRFPEAIGEYQAALRLHPNDRDVAYQLQLALQGVSPPP